MKWLSTFSESASIKDYWHTGMFGVGVSCRILILLGLNVPQH
jgi:hypothetical protein